MRKLGWVVGAVMVLATAGVGVLYGQAPEGGERERGRGQGGGPAAFDPERVKMSLGLLGLNAQEVAAAVKTSETKWKARQALEQERNTLRQTADDQRATEAQLTQAIATYTKAMGRYRTTVQTDDAALVKRLSVRSRAHCLAAGILDNGLGGMGGRTRGGGGGGRGGAGFGGGERPGPPAD